MTTLEELERLLKAGTPGPWTAYKPGDGACWIIDPDGDSLWIDPDREPNTISYQDAALIVAAINALPALLESARRVEILAPYAKLGLAVSEYWPSDFGDIDAFDLFDMLKESGVIVKQPEPYDPEHHDYIEDCEPGDEWYKRAVNIGNVRAALKGT
jgi:hypothetical protein